MRAQELMPNWIIRESEHIMFYFEDTTYFETVGMNKEAYIAAHEATYKQLNGFFNVWVNRKITFCVWGDTARARRILGRPPGFSWPKDLTVHAHFRQTFGHELTHVLSYWAWGKQTTNTSKFFNEGLAVAFDMSQGDKYEKAKTALWLYREIVEKYKVRSIVDVWQQEENDEFSKTLLYPLAGAFVTYLKDSTDFHKFKSCVKNQSLEHAYIVYGREDMDKLFHDFDKLVGLRN